VLLDEPRKAVPYLKKAIELKPKENWTITDNPEEDFNYLLGAYEILQDTASFEKLLAEKIKLCPTVDPNPTDFVLMGNLLVSERKYGEARKIYNRVIALDYTAITSESKTYDGYLGLAMVSYLEKNNKEALDYINKAYAINKKKWELYIIYGIVLLEEKDANNAYEAFKIAKSMHDRKWIKKDLMDRFFETN